MTQLKKWFASVEGDRGRNIGIGIAIAYLVVLYRSVSGALGVDNRGREDWILALLIFFYFQISLVSFAKAVAELKKLSGWNWALGTFFAFPWAIPALGRFTKAPAEEPTQAPGGGRLFLLELKGSPFFYSGWVFLMFAIYYFVRMKYLRMAFEQYGH